MIVEAIEYLTTPCPRWARKLGYLSELIAIRHRARRCRADWAGHLERTKAAILAEAEARVPMGDIVILGAGLCLDVPVMELADLCQRLILVDAVRPRGLLLPDNVGFQTMDVHGVSQALATNGEPNIWARDVSPIQRFKGASLIVSVNLVTQLPILPLRALRRRGLTHAMFDHGISGKIMRDHVSDLRKTGAPVLLIGEARRRRYDRHGAMTMDENIAAQLLLSNPTVVWTWPIVPPGEAQDGSRLIADIGVWQLA